MTALPVNGGKSQNTLPKPKSLYHRRKEALAVASKPHNPSVWRKVSCLAHHDGYARADATIQAAQAAVVDNVSIFAGANTDTINSGRNANIHFTQAQAVTAATLWKTGCATKHPAAWQ